MPRDSLLLIAEAARRLPGLLEEGGDAGRQLAECGTER